MKKFNLIAISLSAIAITLIMSCQKDDESVNTELPVNETLSVNPDELEETVIENENIPLPISDFDSESNTVIIDVNGEQFPVIDIGEGPVVFMIHGWPDSKEMWRFQIPFLVNAGYRVVAPDLRGFGGAPKTENIAAYGLGSLAVDMITIMDNMKLDEVNLVTHDWGAAIGWTLARYYQERVHSFIPISIGAVGNSGFATMEQRRKNWYLYFFAQQEGVAEYELTNNDWSLFRDIVFHPDEENIINNLSEPGALSAAMRPYKANYQGTLLAGCPGQVYEEPSNVQVEYPLVNAPTLGLLGKNDFAMLEPQMTLSKEQVAPGSFEYLFFNDVGHWMMLEQPDRINNIITDFLACHVMADCN